MSNALEQILEALKDLPAIKEAVQGLQRDVGQLKTDTRVIREQTASNTELTPTVEHLTQQVSSHQSTFNAIHEALDSQRKAI